MPISEVFERVKKFRENGTLIDAHTMAYVEYWLCWCIEHNNSQLKYDATAFSMQYNKE